MLSDTPPIVNVASVWSPVTRVTVIVTVSPIQNWPYGVEVAVTVIWLGSLFLTVNVVVFSDPFTLFSTPAYVAVTVNVSSVVPAVIAVVSNDPSLPVFTRIGLSCE